MKRLPNWRPRLAAYLHNVANQPFVRGQMDCVFFVVGAIEAMTGEDLSYKYSSKYDTLKGGFMRLKKAGFRDLASLAAAHLNEVPVAMANVGDIALLKSAEGLAFGLVQGEHIFVRHLKGMAHVPLLDAVRMFKL